MATIIPMAAFNEKRGRRPSRRMSGEQCTILLFDGVRYESIPEHARSAASRSVGKGKRNRVRA